MCHWDQTIQIYSAYFIRCKQYDVIRRHSHDCLWCHNSLFYNIIKCFKAFLLKHRKKLDKNFCCCPGIIYCPMMILKWNMKLFCNSIKLKTSKMRQKKTCQSNCINVSWRKFNAKLLCIIADKACIKGRIMRYKDTAFAKAQKFRKNFLYAWCITNHSIIDSG